MAAMERLATLLTGGNYLVRYSIAKTNKTCILCGIKVNFFRDVSCRLEYEISGLCQKCQDKVTNHKKSSDIESY